MNDAERSRIAADEEAKEKEYSAALGQRAKSLVRSVNQMGPNSWTATPGVEVVLSGELIGRVALGAPQGILGGASDFYIGTAKHDGGDYQVFSWAAPVACTYYRKSTTAHHSFCEEVVGVRVFAHRGGRLVDFEDELAGAGETPDVFPKRVLEVPRAPGRSAPPVAGPASESADRQDLAETIDATPEEINAESMPAPSLTKRAAAPIHRPAPGPPLRTPELLRRQLSAPKTAAMSAVLATLQSDQYDAITRPASESQVLQGHPGTGKTIVAVHRAAYLLNSEVPAEAAPKGEVLILGPTAEYVTHISGALRKLIDDESRYSVMSMPALLEQLAGLPDSTAPTESLSWQDASEELAGLIDLALRRAKSHQPGETGLDSATVYAELVGLLQDPPDDGLDADWVQYLRSLPRSFEELTRSRLRRHRGFMAYLSVRTSRPRPLGHIIVDEAQDIHPIEWEVLGRLGNAGGWTILGDLNQRRTDNTFSSWDGVARILAIEDDDGHAPVQLLERGYRSTAQIIHFANQLLIKEDRVLYSLQQDGEAPVVDRVQNDGEIAEAAYSACEALMGRVGKGSVALITVDPRSATALLARRGWRSEATEPLTWRNAERILRVMPPERARGLEFDGVVVVEPADFPENVGRQGVLYTALTRANRFLTVVHRRPLPRGLKARG